VTNSQQFTTKCSVPDIMRHMSNLIVRAEKEVVIATNYWISSVASTFVTNALKELSKRAGERKSRVVVKIMYDRGSPWQIFENHQTVAEKEYIAKAINLPRPEEIPNLDLQVVNYHRPMLGTFHAKFMIADRKIGLVQSNNIQVSRLPLTYFPIPKFPFRIMPISKWQATLKVRLSILCTTWPSSHGPTNSSHHFPP
jgi:phosphatidylserine/phosphatidylglycerophosphate/cardiolipin synthase-like enzyme